MRSGLVRAAGPAGRVAVALRRSVVAALAAMLCLPAAAALAQADLSAEALRQCERDSKRIGDVQLQLVERALKLGLEGSQLAYAPIIGCLAENESRAVDRVQLKKDERYVVVAVCEKDRCPDIDLTVIDEANHTIAADLESGPDARVDVRPRWDGEYLVKILLAGCREGRKPAVCSFATGIFRRAPR